MVINNYNTLWLCQKFAIFSGFIWFDGKIMGIYGDTIWLCPQFAIENTT